MISILFPTVRPDRAAEVLPSILCASELEIIIVTTPELIDSVQKSCQCFLENRFVSTSYRVLERPQWGTIDAINFAFRASQGEYVFVTNDETTFHPQCFDELLREVRQPFPGYLYGYLYVPIHKPEYDFAYYGKPFAPFCLVEREVLAAIHGESDVFFDPIYKGFYADPDLTLKAARIGVFLKQCQYPAVLYHTQRHDQFHRENVAAYLAADRAVFRGRWDHLGEFKDP